MKGVGRAKRLTFRRKPNHVPERPLKLNAVLSHKEVAVRLGLCRQRVVQLERAALKKLKKSKVLRELFR